MKSSPEIRRLLIQIEEGYATKTWHGPNLKGSIRGLTAREAALRPGPSRHNIWEIVIHCAYWKYTVRRRILGEKKGSFPLKGSNWFRAPLEGTESEWKESVALLNDAHLSMVDAIARLKPSGLRQRPKGSNYTTGSIVFGIAAHDIYHAGQIQLLKRLLL